MILTMQEIKEKIAPIAQKYHLPVVYLFGSYARGEADEDSDLDFAVPDTDYLFQGWNFFDLENDLELSFSRNIDLLTLSGIAKGKSMTAREIQQAFQKERVLVYEENAVG